MTDDEERQRLQQKTKGFLLAAVAQHLPLNLISGVLSVSKLLQNYI